MSYMKPDISKFVKIPVNIFNLEIARITFIVRKVTKDTFLNGFLNSYSFE